MIKFLFLISNSILKFLLLKRHNFLWKKITTICIWYIQKKIILSKTFLNLKSPFCVTLELSNKAQQNWRGQRKHSAQVSPKNGLPTACTSLSTTPRSLTPKEKQYTETLLFWAMEPKFGHQSFWTLTLPNSAWKGPIGNYLQLRFHSPKENRLNMLFLFWAKTPQGGRQASSCTSEYCSSLLYWLYACVVQVLTSKITLLEFLMSGLPE